jgi:hypothetical protein
MKVTIVTLINHELVETYVGAVSGSLWEQERGLVTRRFSGDPAQGDNEGDGPSREVYFREVDVAETSDKLLELVNVDDRS